MKWSYEKLVQIAPDQPTLERARRLLARGRWPELATNRRFIWGACMSRGVRRHQVAVDLEEETFYCNCPSPKHPCKHAIALLIRYLEPSDDWLLTTETPLWLRQWQQRRQQPQSEEARREAERQNALQRARNRDARLQLMQSGVDQLDIWLNDLLRQGLAAAYGMPEIQWEAFAKNMVDAKLGGVARKIRHLGRQLQQEDEYGRALEMIGDLYLFAQAFRRQEYLPAGMVREVLSFAGMSTKKNEVLARSGITDRWLVIGQMTGQEEDLRFRRSWLLGAQQGAFALLLDFAWGEQSFDIDWKAGQQLEAELAYYPSSYPLRALVKSYAPIHQVFETRAGYNNLNAMADSFAEANAAHPWIFRFPVLLNESIPVYEGEQWRLIDQNRKAISLRAFPETGWKLLAASGGSPIRLFGEWDGQALNPLTILTGNRMIPL